MVQYLTFVESDKLVPSPYLLFKVDKRLGRNYVMVKIAGYAAKDSAVA